MDIVLAGLDTLATLVNNNVRVVILGIYAEPHVTVPMGPLVITSLVNVIVERDGKEAFAMNPVADSLTASTARRSATVNTVPCVQRTREDAYVLPDGLV